ncbi:MAG: hypothetical protein ACM3NO_11375 [Deltaproteobacteria bacterium]
MERPAICIAVLGLLAGLFLVHASAWAQEEGPAGTKLPSKLDKIRGGDNTQLAFTGKVRSVDIKANLLSMSPEEGKGSEIFPVKKNTMIRTAKGERISLKELKEGNDIVVYYELKGAQRVVKRIIQLSAGKDAEGKKHPSPS